MSDISRSESSLNYSFSTLAAGLGTSAAYLGSLLYMMSGVREAGVPDRDQTRGMVTSLWVVCDCVGGNDHT